MIRQRTCEACGGFGQVSNPDLRAVLCHGCDHAFMSWFATRPGLPIPTDWPGWPRGRTDQFAAAAQRARDVARDQQVDLINHRPMRPAAAELVGFWHHYREGVTP